MATLELPFFFPFLKWSMCLVVRPSPSHCPHQNRLVVNRGMLSNIPLWAKTTHNNGLNTYWGVYIRVYTQRSSKTNQSQWPTIKIELKVFTLGIKVKLCSKGTYEQPFWQETSMVQTQEISPPSLGQCECWFWNQISKLGIMLSIGV